MKESKQLRRYVGNHKTYPARTAMAPTAPIAPLTATLRPAELAEVEDGLAVDVLVEDPEWLVVVVIFEAPLEAAVVLAADGVARGAEVVPAI